MEQLTSEYYSARRKLVIFSSLLFSWDYIGLSVGKEPLKYIGFHIDNPEAIPLILFAICAYSLIRLWIEWAQCNPQRKDLVASKFDMGTTLFIAIFSMFAFLVQRVIDTRFWELEEKLLTSVNLGIQVAMTIFLAGFLFKRMFPRKKNQRFPLYITSLRYIFTIFVGFGVFLRFGELEGVIIYSVSFSITIGTMYALVFALKYANRLDLEPS